jgi:hypothetical protein
LLSIPCARSPGATKNVLCHCEVIHDASAPLIVKEHSNCHCEERSDEAISYYRELGIAHIAGHKHIDTFGTHGRQRPLSRRQGEGVGGEDLFLMFSAFSAVR